jgi:hypothetical protein
MTYPKETLDQKKWRLQAGVTAARWHEGCQPDRTITMTMTFTITFAAQIRSGEPIPHSASRSPPSHTAPGR